MKLERSKGAIKEVKGKGGADKPSKLEELMSFKSMAQAVLDAGVGKAEDGVFPLDDFDHNGRVKGDLEL